MSTSPSSQWPEAQGLIVAIKTIPSRQAQFESHPSAPVSISGEGYTIWSKCVMRSTFTGLFFLGKRAQSRCRFCWNASCR